MTRSKRYWPGEAAETGRVKRACLDAEAPANQKSPAKARATRASKAAKRQTADVAKYPTARQGWSRTDLQQLSKAARSEGLGRSGSLCASIDAQPSYTTSGHATSSIQTDQQGCAFKPQPQPQTSASGPATSIPNPKAQPGAVAVTSPAHQPAIPSPAVRSKAKEEEQQLLQPTVAVSGLQPVLSRRPNNKRKAAGLVGPPLSETNRPGNRLPAVLPVMGTEQSSTHAVADTAQQNADADMSAAAPLPTAAADAAKKQTAHIAAQKQTAAKKLTAQQVLQPQLLPGAHFDCQGLRLLPGDALLHSEHLAAHSRQAASSSTRPIKYLDVTCTVDDLCKRDLDCSVSDRPYMGNGKSGCNTGHAMDQDGETHGSIERYNEVDLLVRKMLWWRALKAHGVAFANAALIVRDTFVQVCFMAQRTDGQAGCPDIHQSAQACKDYHRMLLEVYGPTKVLSPYVLSIDAINDYNAEGGAKDLHHFRLLQRRFIVYRPKKAAGQFCSNPTGPSNPSTHSGQPCGLAESAQAGGPAGRLPYDADTAASAASSSVIVDIVNSHQDGDTANTNPMAAPSNTATADWDATLEDLWQELQNKTGKLTGKQVQDNSDVATAASCSLLEGSWQGGHCSTDPIPSRAKVGNAIRNCLEQRAGSHQRLYFLDGTFPGDLPGHFQSYEEVPGVWCGVDQKVNAMLPQPMQSSRAGNFFRHLCVESTGTASFTMFAPISPATNITPFHQETKKRRSWNCGSGDFIVQPLSTADNVRKLERVHAAVMGAHKRHGCLLPLEMYLEEDIPLVCYIRDKPYAEMVELPEQSCHCFLSFSNASADPPALKASCNDWHLDSELSSAYLLEKLVGSMAKAGVEAGSPDDGADTWVATPYAMLEPCTIAGPLDPRCTGTWSRPWADEMKGQACTPEELDRQADLAHRCCGMEVLLVRAVEKMLDGVNGNLKDLCWNVHLTKADSLKALQDALPVLIDLQLRANKQSPQAVGKFCRKECQPDAADAHFSQEYMDVVVGEVQQVLRKADMDVAAQQAQALMHGSTCLTWTGSDAASASSCGPIFDRQPFKRTRFGRVQQLQAQEGCTPQGTTLQPSISNASMQWSGAPSQYPSAQATAASEPHKVKAKPASHKPFDKAAAADQSGTSLWAAVANMGGGLKHLAQQLCQQQQATQCAGSGQSQGIKRLRSSNNEVADVEHVSKKCCAASSAAQQLVQTDQVYGVFMHLKYAAAARVDADEEMNSKAEVAVNKLTELCAAAEAVSDFDLLQSGLPVMRSHWLLAMQQEWEAARSIHSQPIQLGKVRDRRCRLEALHDAACSSLAAEHANRWGVVPTNA
ncbi:hypothetical protein WJX77_001831 [Trebouxia sp. C0004]